MICKSGNKSKPGRDATLSQKLNVTSCRARPGEERGCFSLAAQSVYAPYLRHSPIKTIILNLREIVTSFFSAMAAGIGGCRHCSFPSRFLTHTQKKKMKLNLLKKKKKSVSLPSGSVQAPGGKKKQR